MVQFRITQVFVAKLYVVTIKIVNVAVKFYETKSMLLAWYFQINNGVKRIKYYKVVQTVRWTSGQIKRTNWKAVPVQKLTEKAFWTKETISDTSIHFC